MYPAKPLSTKVVMSLLTAILTSASVLDNGFVLAMIARFKSLRTVPNILIANLALVDLFDAIINMPLYLIYTVLEASWFRGKTLGIMISIFDRLFAILNATSMLAIMANMYLAISFDMKYLSWKTNTKALVCVVLNWFISIVTVMLYSIPLFDVDLGEAHVIEYRAEIYKQGKHFAASFMALFIISGAVICFLTTWTIKKKKKKRMELNLAPIQEKARLKDDIKAIKTVGITIAAYFLCYVPAIVYAVAGLQKENLADSWFGFIAWYSLYISSTLNPIIYYLRARRCRSAFRQLLKDPFGSSDIKENPNGGRNRGKRHNEVMGRKTNSETVKGGDVWEVEKHGNQTRQKHSRERRTGTVISSINDLDAEHEVGRVREHQEEKGKRGSKACASKRQVQNSCQGKGAEIEEVSKSKKCSLKKESRKGQQSSSTKKVHPLEIGEMGETGEPDGGKREVRVHCVESENESRENKSRECSIGSKRNAALSNGEEFEKVVKTAWTNEEEMRFKLGADQNIETPQ